MSLANVNDLILARQSLRTSITRLRHAQVGKDPAMRLRLEELIEACTEKTHEITRVIAQLNKEARQ